VSARVHAVVLDCPDPMALATFYSELSGWPIAYADDEWVTVRAEAGGFGLAFQLAPNHQPPAWPDPNRPQQFHLDFHLPAYEPTQSEVLARGAKLLDDSPTHEDFRVFADPAGHPFCLCLGD